MSQNIEKQFLDGYDRYADALYRFIYVRVGWNRELAEDLLQQTFCNAWMSIRKKGSIKYLQAFLYTTARNLTTDHFKRASTQKEIKLDVDVARDDSIINELDHHFDDMRLMRIIQQLPEKLFDVVQLRFIEDMKVGEIARALSISNNAVSLRINRAKKHLRILYEELEKTKR